MNNNKYMVLFVCVPNSARSQMAEVFLNLAASGRLVAESAGLDLGKLNPDVVEVVAELGIDISKRKTKDVCSILRNNINYQAVITVCDAGSAERCPVFAGRTKRIAWSFPDPSGFKGTMAEILEQTRKVRNAIREKWPVLFNK